MLDWAQYSYKGLRDFGGRWHLLQGLYQMWRLGTLTSKTCEKFSKYVLGMKFTIESDHKPLVLLLGYKELHQLPPKILRFCLRLFRYYYAIVHVPDKLLNTADALSCDPLPSKTLKVRSLLISSPSQQLRGNSEIRKTTIWYYLLHSFQLLPAWMAP